MADTLAGVCDADSWNDDDAMRDDLLVPALLLLRVRCGVAMDSTGVTGVCAYGGGDGDGDDVGAP